MVLWSKCNNNLICEFKLTNHLFEEEGKGFGMDLVSLDTQRGRDHGTILKNRIFGIILHLFGWLQVYRGIIIIVNCVAILAQTILKIFSIFSRQK